MVCFVNEILRRGAYCLCCCFFFNPYLLFHTGRR